MQNILKTMLNQRYVLKGKGFLFYHKLNQLTISWALQLIEVWR